MKLFLDIETLPASGKDISTVKQFYKESEEKRVNQNGQKLKTDFETYLKNTSFQGEFGRIFCICFAKDNEAVESLSGDEKDMLEKFWSIAKDANLFIGHNIIEFDLRFIYKRSIIHQIQPSRQLNFARYRNDPIFDIMKEWEKWGSYGAGLHKLSIALGLESPKSKGIDGSKVYDYYLAGKHDEIIKYCKRDVEVTREIYKRITFN